MRSKRLRLAGAMGTSVMALVCAVAQAQPAEQRQMIRFGEELGVPNDVNMTAESDMVSLKFDWPLRWRVQAGSKLCLVIEHSPDLDDSRSFLSLSLNYGVLRSVRLDSSNAQTTEITVDVPPAMLKVQNEIRLSVEQFSRAGGGKVWTRISRRSLLEIRYRATPEPVGLEWLPGSFLGPNPYTTARLAVLAPYRASSKTLEAVSLLVAWLTMQSRPRRVDARVVNAIDGAEGDAVLIVGSPEEQPELTRLRGKVPENVPQDEGVIFESDVGNGGTRCLVVTGKTPDAVLRAARYMSTGGSLNGAMNQVKGDRSVAVEPRAWRGALPLQNSFLLSEIKSEDVPIVAASGSPTVLNLNPTPDAEFLPFGHKATLKLRLNPAAYPAQSVVTVDVNGTRVAQQEVARISNGLSADLSFAIPARLLGRANRLKIEWRCSDGVDRHVVAAWVSRESSFYLPRNYSVKIPDLALLRYRMFPFSLVPDFSDVVVAVPDPLSGPLMPALVELAAAIGRTAPGSGVAFQVKKITEITEGQAARSHMLVFHVNGTENPLAAAQAKGRPLPVRREVPRAATIRESLSPWSGEKCILTFAASTPQEVELAVRQALSPPVVDELKFDAASIANGSVELYQLEQQRDLRHSSIKVRLDAWLQTNWLALPIVLMVASGLLFLALRLVLRHRRQGDPPNTPPSRVRQTRRA